ncbi:MaoC family dehydratase [Gordonia sp. TBRC 11910]|uniref:MaoC family dehydratase n=1 Tax=Gordonia asplenii TaxID=2725283 RepID=A0A848L0R2_9ACTN|nr:MaoC family dehydratase [Gordonia asplenii]NMO04550.1 MaoC family dehydratase [Gordonia asplenii]
MSEQTDVVWTAEEIIDTERVRRYGVVAGDSNAIHTDPEAARAAGLPAPVAHGMLTAGIVLGHATRWATENGFVLAGYDTRFVAPVYVTPGDPARLQLSAKRSRPDRLDISVAVVTEEGTKAVLRPMRVQIAPLDAQ